ncbi:MAG: hypothetical protein WBP86_14585 [Thiobacillaceae bacterium]
MEESIKRDAPDARWPTSHLPFIPSTVALPEFTLRAALLGTLLGVLFGGFP